MIKKTCNILAISFFMSMAFCMLACTKQGPINSLSKLVEEVQANGSNFSQSDWERASKKLEAIEREMEKYQDDYTAEELKEIGRLKGIFLAQYLKYSVTSIGDEFDKIMKEGEGLINGFLGGLSDESSNE